MRNADIVCRRNGKDGPSFAPDFLTEILLEIEVAIDLERNCGYWSLVCSKVFIGNAGSRFIMLTYFVGEKERLGPHLLQGV